MKQSHLNHMALDNKAGTSDVPRCFTNRYHMMLLYDYQISSYRSLLFSSCHTTFILYILHTYTYMPSIPLHSAQGTCTESFVNIYLSYCCHLS